eukprot:scaffold5013_cov22-Tisochrysis_lutea.AAC.1
MPLLQYVCSLGMPRRLAVAPVAMMTLCARTCPQRNFNRQGQAIGQLLPCVGATPITSGYDDAVDTHLHTAQHTVQYKCNTGAGRKRSWAATTGVSRVQKQGFLHQCSI